MPYYPSLKEVTEKLQVGINQSIKEKNYHKAYLLSESLTKVISALRSDQISKLSNDEE